MTTLGLVVLIAYAVIGLALFVPFARWWDREPDYRRSGPIMTLFMCCVWPIPAGCAAVWLMVKPVYERATGRKYTS